MNVNQFIDIFYQLYHIVSRNFLNVGASIAQSIDNTSYNIYTSIFIMLIYIISTFDLLFMEIPNVLLIILSVYMKFINLLSVSQCGISIGLTFIPDILPIGRADIFMMYLLVILVGITEFFSIINFSCVFALVYMFVTGKRSAPFVSFMNGTMLLMYYFFHYNKISI